MPLRFASSLAYGKETRGMAERQSRGGSSREKDRSREGSRMAMLVPACVQATALLLISSSLNRDVYIRLALMARHTHIQTPRCSSMHNPCAADAPARLPCQP